MKLYVTLCAIALLFTAPAAFAHGNSSHCRARLDAQAEAMATFHNPLADSVAVEPFTLRLTGISDPDCRFRVRFDDDRGRDGLRREGGNQRLAYKIAADAAGASIIYDSTRPNSPFHGGGSFSADGRLTLYLIVDLGSRARAGMYRETIRARIYEREDEHRDVNDSDIAFAALVPAHVQAFLTGTPSSGGGYALLDLQELTTGETAQATLRVLATGDFDISFESENGGRLANEAIEGAYVAYDFSIGSEHIDLNSGGHGHSQGHGQGHYSHGQGHGYGHTEDGAALRTELPVQVRVGDVSRSPAGNYRDRITITVTAR